MKSVVRTIFWICFHTCPLGLPDMSVISPVLRPELLYVMGTAFWPLSASCPLGLPDMLTVLSPVLRPTRLLPQRHGPGGSSVNLVSGPTLGLNTTQDPLAQA